MAVARPPALPKEPIGGGFLNRPNNLALLKIPEPAATTFVLLALGARTARRRRK
ncbi:MAG: hypothetical protein H7Z14_17925 [Anaerolineae bacterium]|nr:hypothetical protein [Phycisphaerae bacterium]